ncbi:TraR/DksA family transcriptional regulator [Streptomyces decoyicus]|uniref:TraR/DksA family transcriptional regulator n=1 Tax=Streptomyces decoyicus TaxID=249567 RepID=UPI0039081724
MLRRRRPSSAPTAIETPPGAQRAAIDQQQARAQEARGVLEQTLGALRRLEEGAFGICVVCGAPIGKERVVALPRTELCVDCRRRHEHHR